jgi:hypothetical protein
MPRSCGDGDIAGCGGRPRVETPPADDIEHALATLFTSYVAACSAA